MHNHLFIILDKNFADNRDFIFLIYYFMI